MGGNGHKHARYQRFARVGQALADPVRVELLDLLSQGERSVDELADMADLRVSDTSVQLSALVSAGMVTTRHSGTRIFYRRANNEVSEFIEQLENFAVTRPPRQRVPMPDPRPEVWGGDCKNGHFNDPRSHYCGVCGIGMAQLTIVPRRGPRPPLGVLLIDDGMALRLDTDYVLGRDPERAAEVTSGKARPARLDDTSGSVSRRHLRVLLKDWDVQLVDLGSVNGTYLMKPGTTEFVEIAARQPVTIWPGTTVRLGASRSFRYESHRKH